MEIREELSFCDTLNNGRKAVDLVRIAYECVDDLGVG